MIEIILTLCSLIFPADNAQLVFVGDAMQHQRQIDAARRPDGSLDYSPYFTSIEPYISSADYAVVNLEAPLGGAPYSGYPMFCAHDNYVTTLTDTGFDLVLLANNHILDRRDRGVRRTVSTLESKLRRTPTNNEKIWHHIVQSNKQAPQSAYSFLSCLYFSAHRAVVPVYTDLQPICARSAQKAWTAQGFMVNHKTNLPMSSVGRLGI